jgi:hypothetical protein
MLRWTNRLKDRLYWSKFHWQFFDHEIHWLREAEFVTASTGAIPPPLQPKLDFYEVKRLMYEASDRILYCLDDPVLIIDDRGDSYDEDELAGDVSDCVDCMDILWLSDTEFVSSFRFWGEEVERASYLMEATLSDSSLCLYAYTINQFCGHEPEAPVLPFSFLARLLTPILYKVSTIKVTFHGTDLLPPPGPVLSLVPTTVDLVTDVIEVEFQLPFKGLLEAISIHPFHSKVRLHLGDATNFPIGDEADCHAGILSSQDLNDSQRKVKHLRHLRIPHRLIRFNCNSASFSNNPAFESLMLCTHPRDELSSTMLQGVACNANLKRLTIELVNNARPAETNDFLEWVSLHIRSCRGLSCVHFLSYGSVALKSSSNWDSMVLPSLVMNWILERRKQLSSNPLGGPVAGLSIRAINLGVPLANATNVVSRDPSVSNASAIFHCLHSGRKRIE